MIVCIGAATRDCHAQAHAAVIPGTSNPVSRRFAFGGVARNVAEALARLGMPVALVSRVGRDRAGTEIAANLRVLGVDTAGLSQSTERPTAEYVALIEPNGELSLALADMAVCEELVPDLLLRELARFSGAKVWFADANLPAASLAALAAAKSDGLLLAVNAVSVAKAVRLKPMLRHIDLLFANLREIAALAGDDADSLEAATRAARRVVEVGTAQVVVSAGATGALVVTGSRIGMLPALSASVVDVTGAGDMLAAGTLRGLGTGMDLLGAVQLGLAAAAFSVESLLPVPPDLTYAQLVQRAA